jgi:cytosine/adenosine deaminase-related metal-dependent hydrolase
MRTLHTADTVLAGAGADPLTGGAVLVDGAAVAAVGPFEELAAAHPEARVRRWPGLLTPGLAHRGAAALLERAHHPDPREAAELGTEPLTGDALAALAPDAARRGASARRGLQRLLRHGVTAVVGPFPTAAVHRAVVRAGLVLLPGGDPDGPVPALDPLAGSGRPDAPASAFAGALAPGARADLAVFTAPDTTALRHRGAACCVATVLAGRLAYRGA